MRPPYLSTAVVGTAVAALLTACAGTIPRPTSLQAEWASRQWPGVTLEQLNQNRSLYVMKCSGCHTLRVPAVYSEERWPRILDKMQVRAKITDAEKEKILQYVLSVKHLDSEEMNK